MKISIFFALRKLLFYLFLISFIVSFFIPSIYKTIVNIEFFFLAPIVIIINIRYNSLFQSCLILFLIFTGLTVLTGVPGSAFGYAASASIGLIISLDERNQNDYNLKFENKLLFISTIFYILASLFLIYSNIKSIFSFDQLGEYFGTASINYASITVASFGSILGAFVAKRQYFGPNFTKNEMKQYRIVAFIFSITILTLSIVFSTRSAIFGFLPAFLFALQPKKPFLYFGFMIFGLILIYFIFPVFSEFVISIIVPGRDSIVDLYESELNGQERSLSAWQIFVVAIPYFSFCTSCSEYLSFSGTSNLLALSFPFSLIFVFQFVRFLIQFLKNIFFAKKKYSLFYLILGLSFLNSLLLSVFQADFLSLLSLFFVIGIGLSTNSQIIGKDNSLPFVKR